jgi:hypothetical protein
MTEQELFAAYRVVAGYAAQCACGAWITAPSSAAPLEIGQRITVHNESTEHSTWRAERDAVDALRQPVHVQCSCHGGQS